MNPLEEVWARLAEVSVVQFKSESRTGIGWEGAGAGMVKVSSPSPSVLVFEESGSWRQVSGKEMRFTNVFRWTNLADRLSLEHLRFGPEQPVFLFEMALASDGTWRDTGPHMCKQDCYSAMLRIEDERLFVEWTVLGPTRDETMSYVYF